MKVILELTGLEYRIIHEAVGALLDDAKKEQSKINYYLEEIIWLKLMKFTDATIVETW